MYSDQLREKRCRRNDDWIFHLEAVFIDKGKIKTYLEGVGNFKFFLVVI